MTDEFDRTPCPTCGHLTDFSAEILDSINRVVQWMEQSKNNVESVAIYAAAIDELREMAERERDSRIPLARSAPTSDTATAGDLEKGYTAGWLDGSNSVVLHGEGYERRRARAEGLANSYADAVRAARSAVSTEGETNDG